MIVAWNCKNRHRGLDEEFIKKSGATFEGTNLDDRPDYEIRYIERRWINLGDRKRIDKLRKSTDWALFEKRKDDRWLIVANPMLFILRRFTFTLTVLFLNDFVVLQIAILIGLTMLTIIYYIAFKPFKDHRVEIINEFTVLCLLYFLICFTQVITDGE